ncbi:hypothetical protein HDV03_003842 [Kappamyces sp. JEL0829]|nr:hypothetical protein HDV03_003842 [Kappamyces sp. JEL0829]
MSFLFSNCDFLLSFGGCQESYLNAFNVVNVCFSVLWAVQFGMCLVYLLERLTGPGKWNWTVQMTMCLLFSLVCAANVATLTNGNRINVVSKPTMSQIEMEGIVRWSIVFDGVNRLCGCLCILIHDSHYLLSVTRLDLVAYSHNIASVYKVGFAAVSLYTVLAYSLYAAFGLSDLTTYTVYHNIVYGFPIALLLLVCLPTLSYFGAVIVAKLKNVRNTDRQGKIIRIEKSIQTIRRTYLVESFHYTIVLVIYSVFQSNTLILLIGKTVLLTINFVSHFLAISQYFLSGAKKLWKRHQALDTNHTSVSSKRNSRASVTA